MDSRLYNKTVTCPVCKKDFEMTKVKSKSSKIISRDSDFCVHYEGINPIFYEVCVCDNCGYAAFVDKFEEISDKDAKLIYQKIATRWNRRCFSGERTVDNALEAFKLGLLNLEIRNSKSHELAKMCLRIAWLFRLKGDPREVEFIKYALKQYTETFEREKLPVEKLDEFTCMYMIAELNRRTGQFEESVKWFSRLVSNPEARKNTTLIESAREQFQLAKEQMKQPEGESNTPA